VKSPLYGDVGEKPMIRMFDPFLDVSEKPIIWGCR
jgi:hypothetical protein